MSSVPGSPRLLKGAIIGLNPVNPLASVIVFQYNSDTMTRRVEARSSGGGESGDRSEAFRLTGLPKESITLNVEVDAADQLEQANLPAMTLGTYPTLARTIFQGLASSFQKQPNNQNYRPPLGDIYEQRN